MNDNPRRADIKSQSSIAAIRRLLAGTGREYAWRYLLAFIFMAMVAVSTALTAWIMKYIVDQVFVEHRSDVLVMLSIAVLVISAARGIGVYGSAMTLSRIGNRVVAETQKKLFDRFLELGIDFYDRTPSSDLIIRISQTAASARDVLNTIITSFGRDLFSLIGLIAVMVIQSPVMSLITLVIGPVAIMGTATLSRRVREVARAEFASFGMVVSAMQETARGIRIVKAFGLEQAMRGRMGDAIESVRRRSNRIAAITARTGPLMETLGGFAFSGVMLWAGYATIYLDQKPGAFMSFVTAILLAYEPAKRLARTQVQIETGLIGVKMMFEILDTKPTMDSNPDGPELAVTSGEVVFDKVDFAYRKRRPLFRRLDFVAPGGKMTALVGPSGSGKSTMIALIERFFDVSGGHITIDGQDIATVRLASLRSKLALVSQDIALFRASIRDNIRFGRPDASDEEVETAAHDAMAHDFIMATQDGYDTILGEHGAELSGGQRQRLAIARAMLRGAPIVLLDEATSSLDSESEHQVQVAFDRLMRGRTTIVIAHRLSTVLGADRICVLVDGKIVEQGRHDELLAADKHYARLYYLQFEKHKDADAAEGQEKPAGAAAKERTPKGKRSATRKPPAPADDGVAAAAEVTDEEPKIAAAE